MAEKKERWLKVKKRPDSRKKNQKIYFTCHPEDFDRYFESICRQILQLQDCEIYYTEDMSAEYTDENWETDLESMQLFLFPVTFSLLRGGNRAKDTDLPFAMERHIPVLPLMMEHGLTDLFTRNFGKVQYLSPGQADETAISYEEKLKSYLEDVLVGEELRKRVQAAFDAYIFLSYRKKDRRYANELMRLIHKNPLCRDIAIWYDEFLTPGEDFNENIAEALEKSTLFTLLVTPNLLEDQNYVMRVEYPEAKKAGKEILPVEMVQTDQAAMAAKYLGIPASVKGENDEEFRVRFLEGLRNIAIRENDSDPAHNFLIGLAYLNGIDVEKDTGRAVSLISGAAEAGLPEAMEKLAGMYEKAEGVDRNYREETKLRERLLEWARKEYAEDGKKLEKYMHCLAYAYSRNGNYKKALPLYIGVYESMEKRLGEDHPGTLKALSNLAVIYGKLGNYKKDLEYEKQIYLQQKKSLGPEHPETLRLLGNISYLYSALGQYKKSAELDRIVYERSGKVYGEDHPDTLLALHNLGTAYANLGEHSEAARILEKVYRERWRVCGADHPDTLVTMGSLAVCYGELGELGKELGLEEKLYEKRKRILGEEHPDTLITLSNLAGTYGDLGDRKKEAELGRSLYESRKKILGEEHPDTLLALNNLAVTTGQLGDLAGACEMLQKVYDGRKRKLGEEHPDTRRSLENLAFTYEKLGEFRKAMELREKL